MRDEIGARSKIYKVVQLFPRLTAHRKGHRVPFLLLPWLAVKTCLKAGLQS
jgi:hypothetical protein